MQTFFPSVRTSGSGPDHRYGDFERDPRQLFPTADGIFCRKKLWNTRFRFRSRGRNPRRGAQSTRPGHIPYRLRRRRRLLPVLPFAQRADTHSISVDTYYPGVAQAAPA